MRKKPIKPVFFIVVAVIIILTIFVCCNRKSSTSYIGTSIKTDFQVETEFTYDDWTAKGVLSKSAEEYTISLTEPESVEGMEFKYDGEKVNIKYKDLSIGISDDSLLLNSVSSAIINSIDHAILGKNTTIKENGENYIISGKIDNGNYELEVEQSTGMPVSLKIKNINFKCTFTTVESSSS